MVMVMVMVHSTYACIKLCGSCISFMRAAFSLLIVFDSSIVPNMLSRLRSFANSFSEKNTV